MWTRFMDMHSGGGQKLRWAYVYIEAPQEEAEVVFYKRFGRNPHKVTCTCCGPDYAVNESETLERASAYERGCRWAEDVRGLVAFGKDRPADYREGCYLEPGEAVPEGMKLLTYFDSPRAETVAEYLASGQALAIYAKDIAADERVGEVPSQGYVWQD